MQHFVSEALIFKVPEKLICKLAKMFFFIFIKKNRLRDMLNSEKQDRARSDKQVEKLEGELSMLRKDRERLQGLVSQYEKELIDLKEQVDAALGAEEMVEQLTERNLKLEDEIREILEEKNDLVSRSEM